MTNYNDGSWHGWNGGECPVHPDTVVEVQTYGKNSGSNEDLAYTFSWNEPDTYGDTIIAFRVIKEHKEPREVWMRWSEYLAEWVDCGQRRDAVLFREVLE